LLKAQTIKESPSTALQHGICSEGINSSASLGH